MHYIQKYIKNCCWFNLQSSVAQHSDGDGSSAEVWVCCGCKNVHNASRKMNKM